MLYGGWMGGGGGRERERVNPPRNGIGDVPPTELRALLLLREWNADGWLIIRLKIQFERYIQIVGYPFHSTPLQALLLFFSEMDAKIFRILVATIVSSWIYIGRVHTHDPATGAAENDAQSLPPRCR